MLYSAVAAEPWFQHAFTTFSTDASPRPHQTNPERPPLRPALPVSVMAAAASACLRASSCASASCPMSLPPMGSRVRPRPRAIRPLQEGIQVWHQSDQSSRFVDGCRELKPSPFAIRPVGLTKARQCEVPTLALFGLCSLKALYLHARPSTRPGFLRATQASLSTVASEQHDSPQTHPSPPHLSSLVGGGGGLGAITPAMPAAPPTRPPLSPLPAPPTAPALGCACVAMCVTR